MTLTLTSDITAEDRYISVTGTVTEEPGYQFRLGNELLELQGFVVPIRELQPDPNRWYVRRGLELSTAATHTAGSEIKGAGDAFVSATSGPTPPNPFSSGGGGGSGIASLQGDTGGGATDVTALTVRGASGASVSVTQPGPGEGLVEVTAGGGWRLYSKAFTFDSPGLSDGTGLTIYTPAAGDVFIDAWVDISEVWDGTTPLLDFGTGLYNGGMGQYLDLANQSPPDMTQVSGGFDNWGWGFLFSSMSMMNIQDGPSGYRIMGVMGTDPVKLWVTQDAFLGGADPGASQGAATFYFIVATAIAL